MAGRHHDRNNCSGGSDITHRDAHWDATSSRESLASESSSARSSMSTTDGDLSQQDIPVHVVEALKARGLEVFDTGVVQWGPDSPKHPRRWHFRRKFYDSAVIIFLEFYMTLDSNAGTSIAQNQSQEMGVSTEVALVAFTTVYLVGQAIGSLIFPPIAESYGSQTIYAVACFGFTACCIIIASVPILPVVVVFRFIEGMFSAMPAVVAAGSLENMWDIKARIWVFQLWVAGSVVGLGLGPVLGTFVGLSPLGWPWFFYISGIVAGTTAMLSLLMKESRPSQQLRRQVKVVSRATNFDKLTCKDVDSSATFSKFVRTSLALPVKLFFTEPIVFTISLMSSSVYSLAYLFSEALGVVYADGFDFSPRENALVYLAFGVGAILTAFIRPLDLRLVAKRRMQGRELTPEDKLLGFYVAAPVLAVGLWWFAWTVPPLVHVTPWASIAALCLIGYSFVEFDNVLTGYLTDTYTSHAGSANAPLAFLRALMSGAFPLFGTQLFRLGPNYVLTVLATLATGYCGVAVWFGIHGKRIRERSPFAKRNWTLEISTSTEDLIS